MIVICSWNLLIPRAQIDAATFRRFHHTLGGHKVPFINAFDLTLEKREEVHIFHELNVQSIQVSVLSFNRVSRVLIHLGRGFVLTVIIKGKEAAL